MTRVEEIEARKAEIKNEVEMDGADLTALEEEVRNLNAELETIAADAEKRKAIRDAVAAGAGTVVDKVEMEERKMTETEIRNSKEYIDAYARYIKSEDPTECRTMLMTTNATNGTVAIPDMVYDIVKHAWDEEGIMSRVKKAYIKGNLKVQFEISAGAATKHTEGGNAVAEEDLTLGIVTLVPASIKKWKGISDEAMDLTGEAFLTYIYDEIAHQIAKKAADEVVAAIEACTTTGSATSPVVPAVSATTVAVGTVATAIGQLSDEALAPVVIMNKATWSKFKAAQYSANYPIDPFEGLPVLFNNTIKTFDSASSGDTYAIVGDLGYGALANFPNGEEIEFKFDDVTGMKSDLVNILGRMFVGVGVVAPKAFVKIKK